MHVCMRINIVFCMPMSICFAFSILAYSRKRWCDISGGVISASNCSGAPPHHNSLQFCSGCVRESVGVLTPLLVASGLVIILQPCRRDLDVLELTETPIDSTNCSNDVARTQM